MVFEGIYEILEVLPTYANEITSNFISYIVRGTRMEKQVL
jgi:hypothetical protein